MSESLANKIYNAALSFGFEDCGIISIDKMAGFDQRYQERIERVPQAADFYPKHGDIANGIKKHPWAKSLVVCTYYYGQWKYPKEMQGRYAKGFALAPNGEFGADKEGFENWFIENNIHYATHNIAPLRYAAMMAGLGVIRENNFFYTSKGSYYYLYGYLIEDEVELIQNNNNLPKCSEKCGLCRKNCKTKALFAPYTLNPLRCVSFINSSNKGILTEDVSEEMLGQWLSGCDDCQDACPYNKSHDWTKGEQFGNIEEIAPLIIAEKINDYDDEFLLKNAISQTNNHIKKENVYVLREAARRALRNKEKQAGK